MTTMSNRYSGARPGRPTMKHVAALAGVGIKTVSRVMNNEPGVAEATRAQVLRAAEQLRYQLDMNAGNLRRSDRRTRTLGLVLPSVANQFSGEIHRAVEDAMAPRGIAVFASSVDDDPEREQPVVAALLQRRVDGLIVTPSSPDQSYLASELERELPVVFVDREPVGLPADCVTSDNREGAAAAAAHLIRQGHRRIAYLGDLSSIQTARERRRGFAEEAARAGITGETLIVEELHDPQAAREAALRLLGGAEPPTAIFAAQILVTLGVLRALKQLGLQHRVALVGFDDFELADLLDPGVTVVAQHPEQIGRQAAERILARLDGRRLPPERIVVPSTLIPRGSGEIPPP